MTRRVERVRATRETRVRVVVDLDGSGSAKVATGIGFYDHLLTSLATHSLIDLEVEAAGDLEVDDHHTVEDVALVLGDAIAGALGDRAGIGRFGEATVPMDEALARCALEVGLARRGRRELKGWDEAKRIRCVSPDQASQHMAKGDRGCVERHGPVLVGFRGNRVHEHGHVDRGGHAGPETDGCQRKPHERHALDIGIEKERDTHDGQRCRGEPVRSPATVDHARWKSGSQRGNTSDPNQKANE